MTAPVFVDTSVLIYSVDLADPQKQRAAWAWLAELWKTRLGRLSTRVIQEFYAKVCQKNPSARAEARVEAQNYSAWHPVVLVPKLVEFAWSLQDRFRLSFWDALIVSAAQSIGCRHLLSEDFQSGQDLNGLLVVNPFQADPKSLR
jgi:predicted nucleic acid-binding protein